MGGVHCTDCDIAEPNEPAGEVALTRRADDAVRLWALSADLTGVDAFAAG